MLLDVDTGYMKAGPAAQKTVTDYLSKLGNVSLSSSPDVEFVYIVTGTHDLGLRWKAEGSPPRVSGVGANAEA